MKVILQQDVKTIGKKGQVLEVAEGYARNFLFPRKLAVAADTGNVKNLQHVKDLEAKKAQDELEKAQELGKKVGALTVEMKTKAGEGGRMFGSISTKEIAEAMEKQFKIKLDKRKFEMADPIKALGIYNVHVKLHPKVGVDFKVHVTAQ